MQLGFHSTITLSAAGGKKGNAFTYTSENIMQVVKIYILSIIKINSLARFNDQITRSQLKLSFIIKSSLTDSLSRTVHGSALHFPKCTCRQYIFISLGSPLLFSFCFDIIL